ncbi:MAG: iron-containing alcohol dehydrogenase [Planctomycetaceae bacterium]|nr:iron-containing alcohol dehydrogenase [Planctomycetaceae bacterium]
MQPLITTDFTSSNSLNSRSPASFDFTPRTRLVFGTGTFGQLGTIAVELKANRVLLVTDPGLRDAGHSETACRVLQEAGMQVFVFDAVTQNPTTDDVNKCVEFASPLKIDLIVGLGGGSSMDCAKGANFLLTNGGQMHDYKGIGRATQPMLPMIAIPTTSGTGSEAQSFAVIADAKTHTKMACGDPKAACRVAILDPELTVTMPPSVAAATGIDAMTHAIESFVTTKRNPFSQMFARNAWSLLAQSFATVLREPGNLAARGNMQLGAFFAGTSIEASMLGAAHAAANPLTAHFGTVHGHAVGMLLPHIIRWNSVVAADLYHDLATAAGWCNASAKSGTAVEILADGFTELLRLADMPVSLSQTIDADIDDSLITRLAGEAAQQWTGTFNPRKMDVEAFVQVYRNAL